MSLFLLISGGNMAGETTEQTKDWGEETMGAPLFGVTSFAELDDLQRSVGSAQRIKELTSQFQMIVGNIMQDATVDDKQGAVNFVTQEFMRRVEESTNRTQTKEGGLLASLKRLLHSAEDDDDFMADGHKSIDNDFDTMSMLAGHKAMTKREGGTDYPAADFAYVPDVESPSTWKLRLTESPGKVTVAQLGRAAAAFSSGGFRGNKVSIPSDAVAGVKAKIRAAYRKLGVKPADMPPSIKEQTNIDNRVDDQIAETEKSATLPGVAGVQIDAKSKFSVWKDKAGQYRWLAVYSNQFRDNDYPPEIISEQSHKSFVDLVDAGVVDYPELWHWHIPGTRFGVADMVDYSDGFAIAAGTIDPGHEKEAVALSQMDDIGVSHGMPTRFIVRDKDDSSIINFHITTEISPLPGRAAANRLTDFVILNKELEVMALTADKRAYLQKVGLGPDAIAELEQNLADKAAAAKDAGVEHKEAEADTVAEEPTTEVEPTSATPSLTAEDVAVVFGDALKPILTAISDIQQRMGTVEAEVKELRVADDEKIAKAAQLTPQASLQALIAQSILGNPAAQVDGRSALAKSKPKDAIDPHHQVTGISFVDRLIANTQEA